MEAPKVQLFFATMCFAATSIWLVREPSPRGLTGHGLALSEPTYAHFSGRTTRALSTGVYLAPCRSKHGGFNRKERSMNEDRMQGNWNQVKGKAKEQWGRLTDDDLDVIAGKRDQLCGRIQERHGLARDEAEKQVKDFESRYPGSLSEK